MSDHISLETLTVEELIKTAATADSAGNYQTREAARKALISLGNGAIDVLIYALIDEDAKVRSNAAVVLGKIKAFDAFGALASRLQNDADSDVRSSAGTALGKIHNPDLKLDSVPILISALRDPAPNVRIFAATALSGIGDRRAIEPLTKVAGEHTCNSDFLTAIDRIRGVQQTSTDGTRTLSCAP